jgi:hypothetical protein
VPQQRLCGSATRAAFLHEMASNAIHPTRSDIAGPVLRIIAYRLPDVNRFPEASRSLAPWRYR